MRLQFEILGEPMPQPRARLTTIGGHPRAYDPASAREYKGMVSVIAKAALRGEPRCESGPVFLDLMFGMPVPASWSSRKRANAIAGLTRPSVRPDIDNLAKAILDALNGVLFKDDGQVVEMKAMKCYSANPRVVVVAMWQGGER